MAVIKVEKLSKNEFINELVFDEKPFLKKAIFYIKCICKFLSKCRIRKRPQCDIEKARLFLFFANKKRQLF